MSQVIILLPYERGYYYLYCGGKIVRISEKAAETLHQTYGVPMTNRYGEGNGWAVDPTPTHPSPVPLNLEGACRAIDQGEVKAPKAARKFLEPRPESSR